MHLRPTPELPQFLLGLVFLLLGGWCLVAPHSVEYLSLKPEFHVLNEVSALLIGCFGAQAVLVSILIFWSEFKARTYIVFGLAGSIPFFVFNYYFVFVNPLFSNLMLLDFFGNVSILLICLWGARRHN